MQGLVERKNSQYIIRNLKAFTCGAILGPGQCGNPFHENYKITNHHILPVVCIFIRGLCREAPNVPLYDLGGKRQILYAMADELPDGGVIILNFTSVNCKPCKKEIPELLSMAGSSKKVRLIFVYAEGSQEAFPHAKEMNILRNACVDPLVAVQMKYGVKKYPVTVIISKDYRVLGRFEGYTNANIEKIRSLIPR
jgi:thiol-disulfide isomerase/thioredoxin